MANKDKGSPGCPGFFLGAVLCCISCVMLVSVGDIHAANFSSRRYPILAFGAPAPSLHIDEFLYKDNSFSYANPTVKLIVSWDPDSFLASRILATLNAFQLDYLHKNVSVISFVQKVPSTELLNRHPPTHSLFLDADGQTQELHHGSMTHYPAFAFVFDSKNTLIWSGYSLSSAISISELLISNNYAAARIKYNNKITNDFCSEISRWLKNQSSFRSAIKHLDRMNIAHPLDEQLTNQLSAIIISLYLINRLDDFSALVELFFSKKTMFLHTFIDYLAQSIQWLPVKCESTTCGYEDKCIFNRGHMRYLLWTSLGSSLRLIEIGVKQDINVDLSMLFGDLLKETIFFNCDSRKIPESYHDNDDEILSFFKIMFPLLMREQ